ncbi:WXG100 family type VII secretion target [Bacillus paranthracis]|uniref:WXG100 family type VII secretion target n=1 Tax=Bacillus paranthracis TaxID=2026186 RepID=UPI002151CC3B|nr:WXG100 family type VII secretion target [Bacillus paranthracis]MCR6465301.1 WXG100 family type VII secretion target [Bacillus paranthracis]MCR9022441.1 WXG100 family type VII secretion target [Bacillus paranthracis]
MTQIKVTPEQLEQAAKTVRDSRNYLEQIHKDLVNQTEYIASQWTGATSQRFYQMFNEAKPKMFTVLMEFDKIAEGLTKAAEKFRKVDEEEQKAMEERIQSKMWTDIAGELSGAYDASRAIDGVDPSTGEKVGWFDRSVAGVMVVGSMLQVGKLGKIPKVAKAVDKANEAKKGLEEAKALLKAKRQKQIKINQKVGDDFEKEQMASLKSESPAEKSYVKQVTLQSKSGVNTRIDIGIKDLENGKVDLIELKSSLTAPLTKNQKLAFPEIEKYGATVRSKNKEPFEFLEEIPPTKVKVIRKE